VVHRYISRQNTHTHKIKINLKGAGEVAQRLRGLSALPEVLSSMVAHNHLQWDPMSSSSVSEDSYCGLI
jgi:hypothetical protein